MIRPVFYKVVNEESFLKSFFYRLQTNVVIKKGINQQNSIRFAFSTTNTSCTFPSIFTGVETVLSSSEIICKLSYINQQ